MLFAMPLAAIAQESPKVEIFGGYSYLRGDDDNDGIDMHGFNVSFNQNIVKWAGLKADISGHYGTMTVLPGISKFEIDSYLFLVGPQINLNRYQRIRPYGHVLLGVMRNTLTNFSALRKTSARDTAFAVGLGGGIDINLTKAVALRLFQADYIFTTFNGETRNNFRTSTGLVLRLGEN
jgi:opacity protein-like surface antigen